MDFPKVLVNFDHEINPDCWYKSTYTSPVSYCDIFARHGIIVLAALPTQYPEGLLKSLVDMADGFMFIGGRDYPADYFGFPETEHENPVTAERSRNDVVLFRLAWQTNKPMLGICQGIQLASLAMGGSIVPHLDDPDYMHRSEDGCSDVMHELKLATGKLSAVLADNFEVNSAHHQAVDADSVPDVFQITGVAPDGTVEAIERKMRGFGMFMQWHPERHPDENHRETLFGEFTKAVKHSYNSRIGTRL
ncbi:MAG: gamma-glutamyl-gamma-aminobutyrate hydrolase family protein [Planctomycetota bacterium]|nr:gamma-glutamyl-gamma-aminobutyrate hydrolase family protein [Planctomycetota bacterium]